MSEKLQKFNDKENLGIKRNNYEIGLNDGFKPMSLFISNRR